jgi:AraC-like DNA-binding protein
MEQAAATFPARTRSDLVLVVNGSARVGPIAAIPELLREWGVDPADVGAAVGIDARLFDDPDNTIPFAVGGRLFRECVLRSGCPHFGLLVGMRSTPSSLGVLSHLMQHSPDVGEALRNLVVYLQLQDRGAVPIFAVREGSALFGYTIYEKGVVAVDQIYDAVMAIAWNILRDLCGPKFGISEVLFQHTAPEDEDAYRRFFNAPLRFDSDQTALVFPATWLDHPIVGADTRQYQTLVAEADALMDRVAIDFVAQVRRVLCGLVITGRGTVEQTAFLFGMHRRSLNRKLAARETSFRAVLEEVRFEIAQQLLRDTRIPLVHIAEALGYTAASTFTRAFRRWSGHSPSSWRAALRRE